MHLSGRDPFQVSRRKFLQGGVALAAVGKSKLVSRHSELNLATGDNWIQIHCDDALVFELRAEWFAGNASVWGQQAGEQIAFGIEHSRHSGLDLSADAMFELWKSPLGTQAEIRYPGLGLKFSGSAEQWLSESGIHAFSYSPLTLIDSTDLRVVAAPGLVRLAADGTLHFSSRTETQVHRYDLAFTSYSTLMHPRSAESLRAQLEPTTVIALNRGNERWNLELPRGNWAYENEDQIFESVSIETSEHDANRQSRVLFSAPGSQKSFRITSASAPTGTDGRSVDLTFVEPRYAIDVGRNSHKFEAQLARSQAMRFGPLRLLLSPPRLRPALQAGSEGCCVVAEAGLVGTIDTAVIAPTDDPDPWDVALLTDEDATDSYAKATIDMAGTNPTLKGALRFRIIRPQDALDICFRITNVALTIGPGPLGRLQLAHNASDPNDYSLLIADLPPQMLIMPSIKSSAMTDTDDCKTNCTPPKNDQGRVSAPSRVSMQFLSSEDPPAVLSVDALLEWARYPLNIAPAALAKPLVIDDVANIPLWATEIVAPAGFSVSPDENHAFFGSSGVRFDDGITQQWTARLSKRIEPRAQTSAENAATHFPVTPDRRPSLRPILARKLDDSGEYTLHNEDLDLIVKMMRQRSAPARHCVVSSNGAWLNFSGRWPVLGNPEAQNRSAFKETIAGLLEQKVEFVTEAWLVPTGHRVSVVRSGKLQWCREEDAHRSTLLVARFVEHYKIIYHLPTKIDYDYLRKDPATQTTVQLPFRSIELIGKETPYLEYSRADAFFKDCGTKNPSIYDYWAWVSPDPAKPPIPFEFPVEIVDRANAQHRTTMKMMLACYEQATTSQVQGAAYFYNGSIVNGYNNPSFDPSIDFMQRRVAYASPTQMGNTSYPTRRVRLVAHTVPDLDAAKHNETIPWWPQMKTTDLMLEQVAAFSKPSSSSKADQVSRTFEFATVYKKLPFDDVADPHGDNRAEVVLSLVKDSAARNGGKPVQMDFNPGQGGGLAMPSTNVVALARKTGTIFSHIADLNNLDTTLTDIGKKGMTVAEMFRNLGRATSLLGAVDIADVLEEVADGVAQASQVPLLAVKQLHELEQGIIGTINETLKPIFDFITQADTFYNICTAQIDNLKQQLPAAIQVASSLLRVIATEQRPGDIDIIANQGLDTSLNDPARRLSKRIGLSTLQRIQAASSWPPVDDGGGYILPTLYQARDYALNSALQKPAEAVAKKLDDALNAGEDQLQKDLDYAYALAGQVVGIVADTLVLKFVNAVRDLVAGITSADVETAIRAFEAVADMAASIPTLDQAAANIRDGISDSLKKTAGACGVTQLQGRAALLSAAVTQLGASVPVGDAVNKALAPGGIVETTCSNILKRVLDAVDSANAIVKVFQQTEEQFRQAFVAQQQGIVDAINAVRDLLTIPKHINVHYNYATPLKNSDSGLFIAEFDGRRAQFNLNSSVLINLDGTPPQFDIAAKVTDFRLKLIPSFPFVIVGFTVARFESHNGAAPSVSCPFDAKNVQLVGPLDFVAGLAQKLHLPDGMMVQITDLGVLIGVNIHLPAITCGAFNIVNISVFTAVKLDFTGGPLRLNFGFANPNQHFTMTYLFLGGGGFVNLEFAPWATTTKPGMAVTAALEAGAMAALDFGIAHGEVHIFAGIYMSLRPADLLLSGYFRAGGEFDVLGLISASIEFLMSLCYENRRGQAWLSGDCEVDIDVHVLFFSETVTLHMHHDFSGSSAS